MEKMAKQLLGMVATVDREREQLRQVGEAYAKLAGENVDLLGDKGRTNPRQAGCRFCCVTAVLQ